MGLAGEYVNVSFVSMALTVMKVILVPLVLGLLVHKAVGEKFLAQIQKVLVLLSAFAVLSILGGVVAVNGAKIVAWVLLWWCWCCSTTWWASVWGILSPGNWAWANPNSIP